MKNKLEFNNWMLKINNIYYSNNDRMALAFDKIEDYEEIQCSKPCQV
jgi:hypothetical protein